jgi:CBS domain-containing protein
VSTECPQQRVGEEMRALVVVTPHTPLRAVVRRMLVSGAACAAVVSHRDHLVGLITNHELVHADDVQSPSPITLWPEAL